MKGRKRYVAWAFLLPNLLGVAVFALFPMLDVLFGAFRSAVGSRWVGLQNFRTVLENRAFRLAARNTGEFMLVCIPLLLMLSLLLALGLRRVRGGRQLRSAFLLPMAVPAASVVLVWKLFFHQNGLLNGALQSLGLQGVNWMGSGASFWVLIISYLWKNLGYTVVLWTAALGAIPGSIYEAAQIDGANGRQSFFRITLPLMCPSVKIIVVTGLIGGMKAFDAIYSMTSGGPGNATETVMTVMMKKGISDGFYSVGSAFGVCFFIIVLIISGVTTKIMGKWGEAIS